MFIRQNLIAVLDSLLQETQAVLLYCSEYQASATRVARLQRRVSVLEQALAWLQKAGSPAEVFRTLQTHDDLLFEEVSRRLAPAGV